MLARIVNGTRRLAAGPRSGQGDLASAIQTFPLDAHTFDIDNLAAVGRLHPLFRNEVSMAINIPKVLVGGIAAGVVINVIDFVANTYILGARMKAETDAFKPGLSEQIMTGS